MDSLISAAARALAAGDALGALKRVALRDDPPALALRGIAMAQLGEHLRSRELLKRAERGFGAHEEVARSRCVVAEAEVALAMRDLGGPVRQLGAAAAMLEAHDDRANALHARLVTARRLLLLGCLKEAAFALGRPNIEGLPPSRGGGRTVAAELALRSLAIGAARAALDRAQEAAERDGCRRSWPRWRRRVKHSSAQRLGASLRTENRRCAWRRSQPFWLRARWRSMPAGTGCGRAKPAASGAPAGAVRVGAHARRGLAGRRGPAGPDRGRVRRPPGRWFGPGAPARRDRPPARAGLGAGEHRSHPARFRLAAERHGRCRGQRLRPSTASTHRWWRCSPMARPGRPRIWHWPWVSQRTLQRALAKLEAAGQVRSLGCARACRWLGPP